MAGNGATPAAGHNLLLATGDPERPFVARDLPRSLSLHAYGRMSLLARHRPVVFQHLIDDLGETVQLWTLRWLGSSVARRLRETKHLRNCSRIYAKFSRYRALALTFNKNRSTNPTIKLHALHPPPSNLNSGRKAYLLMDFYAAVLEKTALTAWDFCIGAYIGIASSGECGLTCWCCDQGVTACRWVKLTNVSLSDIYRYD
jgi:hypothetical protein